MRRLLRLWSILLLALLGAPPVYADSCRPVPFTTVSVLPSPMDRVLVPVLLDERPTIFEIDTGSDMSLVSGAMAASMGLRLERAPRPLIAGADGKPIGDFVLAHSVALGGVRHGSMPLVVLPRWSVADQRATGMLGADFLRNWDVELDLSQGRVAFYATARCLGTLDPFRARADPIAVTVAEGHIVLPVQLDGRRLRALLDTGATNSSLSLASAERLFNLGPELPGAASATPTLTTDGGRLPTYRRRFRRLEIGSLVFDDPTIDLVGRPGQAHVGGDHEMVLGLQQIRQLRIYIAYRQQRLYVGIAD